MRYTKISLCILLFVRIGFALDITTSDGQTYTRCAIARIEPDAIRITHANGAARIPYEKLPVALQKQYFDGAKVVAYRQQAENAQIAAELKAVEERNQRANAAALLAQRQQDQAANQVRQEREKRAVAQKQEQEKLALEQRRKSAEKTRQFIGIMVFIVISTFIYFIPSIIGRGKTNARAIFVLNLFLGWTFIGWVVSLVWAFSKDSAMDTLAREQINTRKNGGRYIG